MSSTKTKHTKKKTELDKKEKKVSLKYAFENPRFVSISILLSSPRLFVSNQILLKPLSSIFDLKIIFCLLSCTKTIHHWYNTNISRFTFLASQCHIIHCQYSPLFCNFFFHMKFVELLLSKKQISNFIFLCFNRTRNYTCELPLSKLLNFNRLIQY